MGFSESKPEEILSRRLEEPEISEPEYDSDEEFNYQCFVTTVQKSTATLSPVYEEKKKTSPLEEGRKNLRKKRKQTPAASSTGAGTTKVGNKVSEELCRFTSSFQKRRICLQ